MKPMSILKAINDIDDKYIQEAAPSEEEKGKIVSFRRYVRYAAAIAALALVSVMAMRVIKSSTEVEKEPSVQIASPITEYASLEEAQKAVGFELGAPSAIEGIQMNSYLVYTDTLLEVNYTEEDTNLYSVRKQKGSEDISGDYNTYSQEETVIINDYDVMIKGNDDKYYLATWTSDGYSYSFSADNGMSKDDIINTVKKFK